MRIAFFAIEETTHAELARQRAVDRFVQHQVTWLVRAETAVSLDLHRQLRLDAFELRRGGVDLAFVLQGDALFRVLLVTYDKRQVTPTAADAFVARFDRQRNTDNRQPVGLL